MKTVVVHPSVEREMNAVARFYEERSPGLGG
jgi:hypothetical protein